MATTPKAYVSVKAEAGNIASGSSFLTVIAPVFANADAIPRQYASAAQVFEQHGYSEGLEFASLFADEAGTPFLFVGLPVVTQSVVGQVNTTGNTGTSVVSLVAGPNGPLCEAFVKVRVAKGGVVGTDQIQLEYTLDGALYKPLRLGTSLTYAIPYFNAALNLTAGTLIAGDVVYEAKTTSPKCDAAGVTLARQNLAAGQKLARGWIIVGDSPDLTFANAVLGQANTYETANERFQNVRVSARDHLSPASMSKAPFTVSTIVTFAEVGATGDTITRVTGSWLADGVAVGDMFVVAGTALNNITSAAKITAVTATVLTLDTDDLIAEVNVLASITFSGSLTFTNAGDTVLRNRGSWIDDGFRVGQLYTASGTGSNNVAGIAITAVTPTLLTLAAGGVLANEVIKTSLVTITVGETKTQWGAALDAEYETLDGQPRISISGGRARKLSPFSGWNFRRPAAWAAAIREFQHDLHIPSWKKEDGSLAGWTLTDNTQQLVEYDDRVDGGAMSAGRFTSFRTYANDGGTFISLDLTRDSDGNARSYVHNANVVNLAMTMTHAATEDLIGRVLTLNEDGTATRESLASLKDEVNRRVRAEMLRDIGEGPRCSICTWTPSSTDILSGAEALLTGVLQLVLNGTLHSIRTTIKVK